MVRPSRCFPKLFILSTKSVQFGDSCFVLLSLALVLGLSLTLVLPLLALVLGLSLTLVLPLLALVLGLSLTLVLPLLALVLGLSLTLILPLLARVLGSFSGVPTPLPFLDLSPDCSCNHHHKPSYLHCAPRHQRRRIDHFSKRLMR